MPAFRLRKWYLDCVDAQGEPWIGYFADLRLWGLSLFYCASLRSGRITERTSFFPIRSPRISDSGVSWFCRPLDIDLELHGNGGFTTDLPYESAPGKVAWQCLSPRGTVRLRSGREIIEATGYAEKLEIRVEPWKLGIRELRWGRFIGTEHSVVWTCSSGSKDVRVVYQDAQPSSAGDVSDRHVMLDDGALILFSGTKLIRDCQLQDSLSGLGGFRNLVPRSFLTGREQKWCSRGEVRRGEEIIDRGWVIHELVEFAC